MGSREEGGIGRVQGSNKSKKEGGDGKFFSKKINKCDPFIRDRRPLHKCTSIFELSMKFIPTELL